MERPERLPLSMQRSEALRQQREVDNKQQPFLKLPAELRNEIYELALPRDRIFNTGSTKEVTIRDTNGNKHSCHSAQRRRPFRRQFGITQVCRQLRSNTLKLAYASNTFMLRTVADYHMRPQSMETVGVAEKWVKSRPEDVLSTLPRIVLQLWDAVQTQGLEGERVILFDFDQGTAQRMKTGPLERLSVSGSYMMSHRARTEYRRQLNTIYGRKLNLESMLGSVDKEVFRRDPEAALLRLIKAVKMRVYS